MTRKLPAQARTAATIRSAARSDDPWAAFGELLRTMAEAKAGNRIFAAIMASVGEQRCAVMPAVELCGKSH